MSLLLDRQRCPSRYLAWKIRIFSVAAVVALVGMYLNNPWITGAALVLLFVGMMLRFLPEPTASKDSSPSDPG
ncbi:MAG: hypothetical protein EXR91_01520 [Gemmatimonadetes bacterium]|nr:hypothetical protein [Gemmatimonadota bacterium]